MARSSRGADGRGGTFLDVRQAPKKNGGNSQAAARGRSNKYPALRYGDGAKSRFPLPCYSTLSAMDHFSPMTSGKYDWTADLPRRVPA